MGEGENKGGVTNRRLNTRLRRVQLMVIEKSEPCNNYLLIGNLQSSNSSKVSNMA